MCPEACTLNKLSEISYPYPHVGNTTLLSTIFYCCHRSRKVIQSHLKGNRTQQLVRLMTCGWWLSIPRNEGLTFPLWQGTAWQLLPETPLPCSPISLIKASQYLKEAMLKENSHLTALLMPIIKHCWFRWECRRYPRIQWIDFTAGIYTCLAISYKLNHSRWENCKGWPSPQFLNLASCWNHLGSLHKLLMPGKQKFWKITLVLIRSRVWN